MVSRDTTVQFAVVAAILALGTLSMYAGFTSVFAGLFVAAWYLLLFAGAHIYLALRGDGESVPVSARWRFVGVVSLLVLVGAVAPAVSGVTVAGTPLSTHLWALSAAVFAGYLVYEVRDAYRAARPA